jgi:hypothetical protein
VHPNLTVALAEDRRSSCTCDTATGQLYDLCRRCRARMVWRRCTGRPPRRSVHHRADRRTRDRAWIFAMATSILRTIGKGTRSC